MDGNTSIKLELCSVAILKMSGRANKGATFTFMLTAWWSQKNTWKGLKTLLSTPVNKESYRPEIIC